MVTKEWAAIHRKHHAKCETVDDPHSPQVLGINTGTNLQPFQLLIPSEGVLCVQGVYANSVNIVSVPPHSFNDYEPYRNKSRKQDKT